MIMSMVMALAATASAAADPGKTKIAEIRVSVYHATNGNPKLSGTKAAPVSKDLAARFGREERLRFRHYRMLGKDTQPLLRSYESWAEPLKPSDEVMVRFEAQGRPTKQSAALDLELWLARKKIVKTYARIDSDKPLLMLGPEWRGGRLIIEVAFVPKPQAAPKK